MLQGTMPLQTPIKCKIIQTSTVGTNGRKLFVQAVFGFQPF